MFDLESRDQGREPWEVGAQNVKHVRHNVEVTGDLRQERPMGADAARRPCRPPCYAAHTLAREAQCSSFGLRARTLLPAASIRAPQRSRFASQRFAQGTLLARAFESAHF